VEVIASGVEDYYLSGHEAPGCWTGKGAAELGLEGRVLPDDLRAVLEGDDPHSGERLVGWHKRPGYDLTLSAPKSVSLLWGLGNRSTAAAVEESHEAAVDAAIAYLEDAACLVRRGRGGRVRLPGVGLVGASFRHRTSRAGDPNLHSHVVVANMTQAPDGEWSSLFGAAIYRHARTAGHVYQAVLRHGLSTRLGVGFEPAQRGVGEVAGVPLNARRAFSKRRVEIEKAMADHGTHSRRGAQVAALDTRPAKELGISELALRQRWREQARELGVDVAGLARHKLPRTAEEPPADLGRQLTEEHATFDRRAVLCAVAESCTQGLPYAKLTSRGEAFLASADVREVAPGRWTTPEMLAIEKDALQLATSARPVRAVHRDVVAAAMAARPSLSAEQRRAVEAVTTRTEPVAVVVGQAGSGKTFALDAARAAWQGAGQQVIGAALAARAARQLEVGSGIPSSTITSLLSDLDDGRRALGPDHVVVIDEAGMVGTRDLHRLVHATAAASAKLVLVGDNRQLAEIAAGGLFSAFARRLGCAELTENRRIRDGIQRAVAHALRDRDIGRALQRLRRSDRLVLKDNAEELRNRMAEDWLLEHRAGGHTVMLALHRADVADLNRRVRSQLRAVGELGDSVVRLGELDFAVGDRVVALRNRRSIGLLNGTQGTVQGRSGTGLVVATDEGTAVEVPLEYLREGHLTHAYALTIHKSQGMTCDVALVLGDDGLHAEAGYTAMTRGRAINRLYAVTADDHSDLVADLRRSLERSTAKTAAIEYLDIAR
ncbi:MAG: relaxase domain-containing protein, partial [Actinobacteria bacterium]|nr:relaxase domain-containing protein [Actinomycetota bacterium]